MEVPIRSSDRTWLHMDRPNNLMCVNGVLWFREQPDWDAVTEVLRARLVERFPVFHRRAREVDGTWMWQDDPDFSLDHHIRRVTLEAPADLAVAREYVSTRVSQPLDREHPLWEFDLIGRVDGIDGGSGALVLGRLHHGIADGVRLVQVLLSLCDLEGEAVPASVGRTSKGRGPVGSMLALVRRTATDVVDFGRAAGGAALRAPKAVVSNLGTDALEEGFDLVRDPTKLTDAISDLSAEGNKTVNSMRSASRIAFAGRSADTVWSGVPGVEKHVSWVTGIDLGAVKEIGARQGATVNDVLLATVSRGITDYLRGRGADEVDEVRWMVPVSLKPIDADLPEELGNYFAVVMLPMPLGVDDPGELIDTLHYRMNRIKNSAEPLMVFGVQRVLAEAPQAIAFQITNFLANKTVGQLTNVPGPRAPMNLAGTPVAGLLGWVPTSGDQPLGICILSYNGQVNIGVLADRSLIPDVEDLADRIEQAFGAIYAEVLGRPLPTDED